MRFLIIAGLCATSAFVGAKYSRQSPHEWQKIEKKTKYIHQEMNDKVHLLGEQTELLHKKLSNCLNQKYECCYR